MSKKKSTLQLAAKNGTHTKPPGGRRVSHAEVQRRLDHADQMLREGKARADVVASMMSTFGVSTRAADSYIARARERWADESKGEREVERAATLARLDRLSGKAEKRGQFGAAVSAEKLRAQVTGVLAPHSIEVKATVAPASPPNDENLSDHDIIEELAEIAVFMAHLLGSHDVTATPNVVDAVRILLGDVDVLAQRVGIVQMGGPQSLPSPTKVLRMPSSRMPTRPCNR